MGIYGVYGQDPVNPIRGFKMKIGRHIQTVIVLLSLLGMLAPAQLLATAPEINAVKDVALHDGGVLVGQVVDPQGAAKAGTPVTISFDGQTIASTNTGSDGYFAVKGLRGGVHQVATTEGQGAYRLWAAGTAPPAAQEGVLVVAGNDLARGQSTGGPKALLANPLVIAGVVATAVAVPVAVVNSRPASP
jgi:hypothetical protein